MGTSSEIPKPGGSTTLEEVWTRLDLVEERLSESLGSRRQLDSEVAQQTQRLEQFAAENAELKATRAELQFDLSACRDELVAAQQECLVLKHDKGALQLSDDRLVSTQAELEETKEQLVSTQRSVVLLEHDNEDLRKRETELSGIKSQLEALRAEHARVAENLRRETKRAETREDALAQVKGSLTDARRDVERLQKELRRQTEANARARVETAQLKKVYDVARADCNDLDALVAQLASGLELMVRSRRWRLGHMLLSLPRRLVFVRTPPTVTDVLLKLVGEYRDGRRASVRKWRQLADTAKVATSTSSGR